MRFRAMIPALVLWALQVPALARSDWLNYNRTLTSERFSPLGEIDAATAPRLHVVCFYDTGQMTAFQSGLVQRDDALFATTEHDTLSIDPDTCRENWRVREEFRDSYLGAQRGVAIEDGRVFRGGADGLVHAYDEKTGRRLWSTSIADPDGGESVPAAPIAWQGLVFIGNGGGDNKGVKGRMYALDAATGRIVWEFFLVPRGSGDRERGPQAPGSPAALQQGWPATDAAITGGATWTSYSLDPATGLLYVPSGNPAPDFVGGLRPGENLFTGSVVVLDARTGAFRRHFLLSPHDVHDWDASSAPALFTTKGGRRLMAVAPKDGNLYGFDLATGERLYDVPLTTHSNVDTPLGADPVRFCPGTQGGAEWNGAAYDPVLDTVITGQVDWCSTVRIDADAVVQATKPGEAWTGSSAYGFGKQDDPKDWAGWVVATDALSGARRWTVRLPAPVLAGVTPTAGGVVFAGDMGGSLYALDAATGARLWSQDLGGAVSGGLITYDTGAGQKVAASTGMTSKIWPTPKVTARIYVLGIQ